MTFTSHEAVGPIMLRASVPLKGCSVASHTAPRAWLPQAQCEVILIMGYADTTIVLKCNAQEALFIVRFVIAALRWLVFEHWRLVRPTTRTTGVIGFPAENTLWSSR